MTWLVVFIGAGLGGACRHAVNLAAARLLDPGFPYGTLTVNVVGSLLMGLLVGGLAGQGEATHVWRLFLATGVLGGFTTFSAFSLDAVALGEGGSVGWAMLYVAASVGLSLGALMLGLLATRQVVG